MYAHFWKLSPAFFSLVPSPPMKLGGTGLEGQPKATSKPSSDGQADSPKQDENRG